MLPSSCLMPPLSWLPIGPLLSRMDILLQVIAHILLTEALRCGGPSSFFSSLLAVFSFFYELHLDCPIFLCWPLFG